MQQSPIIQKIVLFGIMSALISLMLACIGFGIVEFYKIKNEAMVKTQSQGDILAYSLQPTLVFDDKDAADKILLALRDDKSINRVILYKADGQAFASFIHSDKEGNIKLDKNIFYNQKLIGRLEIDAIYLGIQDKYIAYLLISLLIIMISIPASYLISAPIRKQVSLGVAQLEKQSNRLRQLADQVAATEQSERKRIAAIIHDHLQQLLVACKLQLALVSREMTKQQYEKAIVGLKRVEEFLDEATRAAKTLTVELRPPVLYEDGLAAAFQWLANKFKRDHNLEVSFSLGEIPQGLSDTLKIMIFESIKELLFNVVKYSGVHTAELSLKYDAGVITVSVEDHGAGFDPHNIEKMSSDKGFGLFSIRERLRLVNGELRINSQQGHGTKVEIILPVDIAVDQPQGKTAAREEVRIQNDQKSKKIKILLVDDHRIVREGLANLLKENPVFDVVAQAENGMEAVEKAEAFQPDVIVMDINMPKLNGIEATRIIKKKFAKIDIIGLSVQEEKDIAESMKNAGATALLNKAGNSQDLIQMILNCGLRKIDA